jgi:hypothetical protein
MVTMVGQRWRGLRSHALLALPTGPLGRALAGGARLGGAALLVSIGLIHLVLAPTYYQAAAYIGALFYVMCGVAWVSAAAMLVGVRGAWVIGALASLGAFAGLLLAATVGLPGFTDSLSAPYATLALVLEAGFVALYAVAAVARRSLLLDLRVRAGQRSSS